MILAATPPTSGTITKPIDRLYTVTQDFSEARARASIQAVTAQHGVSVADLAFSGPVFESLPPKGGITGSLTGPGAAVDAALAAVDLLDL